MSKLDSMSVTNPAPGIDQPAFVPLEANPELLTQLLHRLGLSPALQMHDVYSLTDPALVGFVPRPALALLLVFPVSEAYEAYRKAEDEELKKREEEEKGKGNGEEDVVWFPQTIRNACGMMGLLHAVCNGPAREFIEPNSTFSHLYTNARPLPPAARATLVEQNRALATANAQTAAQGDTAAPAATDDIDLHYVCFVVGKDGVLWELDGSRQGPIKRGVLGTEDQGEVEDVLSERALACGPRRFLELAGADLRFSAVALAGSLG